jgi:SAM-dependent methyltransferase
LGRIYKGLLASPVLFLCARRFGPRIIEVGAGTGNGVLGAFSSSVVGLDINPLAVEYCKKRGLNVQLINENGSFPVANSSFDACILDNVLEHIENSKSTLDECWRVTKRDGGMVIVVPGERGFSFDPDHKVFYDKEKLRQLDNRWSLVNLFAIPSFFLSQKLSKLTRHYYLVAVYKKNI